ncbi:hypothetical protein R1sor_012071 [Riccia sorocarpa]|uniref:Uncharacterized protein n=1 Tax=Riccia sorocarpa TaxID=122646 RepID=A0ABD3I2R2_9MARC
MLLGGNGQETEATPTYAMAVGCAGFCGKKNGTEAYTQPETAEKNELRDEKMRLKADKERLEQQLKSMTIPSTYLTHPATLHAAAAAFAAQAQAHATSNKAPHVAGYPGMAMWQWMPQAAVDTSQDHVLRPPVA